MTAFPFTPKEAEQQAVERETPVKFNLVSDFTSGFAEENFSTIAINYMVNHQDFPEQEGYNPKDDPQVKPYEDYYDHFMFSKSSAETTAIIDKLNKHAENNYASPWYHIGRITGAFLDPSSLLLFSKYGQSAKIFGSAFTAEELAKQMLDPARSDDYVPWVIAGGYGVPYLLNKMSKGQIPANIQQKLIEADEAYHAPKSLTVDNKIYIDGKFVDPNQKVKTSSVGAARTEEKAQPTPKELFEGESFIKTRLGLFGEDGPWTPVFRLVKSKSLNARKMIADILDTPLLKLKNTEKYGFQASEASIETKLRMMEVGNIEAMQGIKQQYLAYLKRVQGKEPTTELGINLSNRFNNDYMSISQFGTEVAKARLNKMQHEVPEVAAAARITQEKVYGPLGKEVQELGIRKIPIEQELKFWESALDTLKKKKEGTISFKSKIDGQTSQYTATEINNKITKLKERLIRAEKLVDDYINIIYNKPAIEQNKNLFKEIIREDFIKRGLVINNKKLNQLVEDLSNHFPFIRFEKTKYTDNVDDLIYERFAFNRPRYARSTRARELNLLPETQAKLIDNNFIVGDIFSLMKSYYRQISPDILFTKKYGDPNALGIKYISESESMTSPGIYQVASEYNKRIDRKSVV